MLKLAYGPNNCSVCNQLIPHRNTICLRCELEAERELMLEGQKVKKK